jgi:hypothetical protein
VAYLPSDPKRNLVTSIEDARIAQVGNGFRTILFCGAFWLAAAWPAVGRLMRD